MTPTADWARTVSNPLGLAGFALLLLYLAWRTRPESRLRWAFVSVAILAALSGIGLAFWQDGISEPRKAAETVSSPPAATHPTAAPISAVPETTKGTTPGKGTQATGRPKDASSEQAERIETHGAKSPIVNKVTGDVEVDIK